MSDFFRAKSAIGNDLSLAAKVVEDEQAHAKVFEEHVAKHAKPKHRSAVEAAHHAALLAIVNFHQDEIKYEQEHIHDIHEVL